MNTKTTLQSFFKDISAGKKITFITAYDSTLASLATDAGVNYLLVGDSLGMVIQGAENTLGVSLDEIIYHTKAVRRGAPNAFIVADMPFMSYQSSYAEGIQACGRAIKEGGADAVKLEGGAELAELVTGLVKAGIPVMGHVGMNPQQVLVMGGFKAQGKTEDSIEKIIQDTKILADAGCFSFVIEAVKPVVVERILQESFVPLIGIGAGSSTAGQVLVIHDVTGMHSQDNSFRPKFVRQFGNAGAEITKAISLYKEAVESSSFPASSETY